MDEKLYIIANFELNGEHREEAMAALTDLAEATRTEPGCVSFILTQNRADPNTYVFLEIWANEAAFQTHRETPHLKEFRNRIEGKRTEPDIIRLQRVL